MGWQIGTGLALEWRIGDGLADWPWIGRLAMAGGLAVD